MNLTIEERSKLLVGKGNWHTNDLDGKVASVKVSDGPHGLRAQEDGQLVNDSVIATCFPTACAIACGYDEDLAYLMGQRIALECKKEGVGVLLGPGVCIKRSPLCGRNFEYYSEDPYLAGKMGAAFVRGVQSQGVGTSLKHFAGNNQETHRMISNSIIDERTLNEIYLRAFEIVVKEADPATIMASYNLLNGVHATMNNHLLKDILRDKWGYKGVVLSDWGACGDLVDCLSGGLDLEMPDSKGNHLKKLLKALKNKEVSEEDVVAASDRILALAQKYQHNNIKTSSEGLLKKNHDIARKIETECAVLLKNDDYLPLRDKHLLIIGDLARKVRFQGGGSSHINTEDVDDIFEELKESGYEVEFVRGYDQSTLDISFDMQEEALSKAKDFKGQIFFFGGLTDAVEGEGFDRDSYELPANQMSLIKRLLDIREDIGFISFSGSPYAFGDILRCKAILQMYLGGEGVMGALCDLLTGKASPCGRLAESYPLALKDTPCFENFGLQNETIDDVKYLESLYVGYRYYESCDIPVAFSFGDGLSYVDFDYSDLKVNGSLVSFTLKNKGNMKAKEVCQVYIENPEGSILRAKKELRGFKKVELEPGEETRINIKLDDYSFKVFKDRTMDVEGEGFVLSPGKYVINVGPTMHDIRLKEEMVIEGEELKSNEDFGSIPLSLDDFKKIYTYELSDISHIKKGEYTMWNSLSQMAKDSAGARALSKVVAKVIRQMAKDVDDNDPSLKMMINSSLDGPIDLVANNMGKVGAIIADSIVARANK